MELKLITSEKRPRSLTKSKNLYDYLPDVNLSEMTQEQKKKEFKTILHLLEMNYGRKFDSEKIITFIQLMSKDGYGIQRIKDCFENLIRNHPYPNFTYSDLTNYSKELFTQYDILKSGRNYFEFIRCETPSKEIFYWDKKNGELPKPLLEKPLQKSKYVYFFDKKANKPCCWDETLAGECPYPNVNENEFNELLNSELNARLECKYYSENVDEISEKFLKKYVKII